MKHSIGNDSFQNYCNEHNIPKSYRIWAWHMWVAAQNEIKNMLMEREENLEEMCNSEYLSFKEQSMLCAKQTELADMAFAIEKLHIGD